MKKLLVLSVLISGLFLALSSCEKEDLDPDYPFTVEVLTYQDSIRVPNAMVQVFPPVQGAEPYFEGSTNDEGRVSFEYDKEAIFLIRATRGPLNDPSYIGCTEVRLAPNETVVKTVYLRKVNPEIPGC